jgi:hypothetical protein
MAGPEPCRPVEARAVYQLSTKAAFYRSSWSLLTRHADEHRPEYPILLAVGWTSPTVIGSALRVAAPRSLLGIVDQVQFAW